MNLNPLQIFAPGKLLITSEYGVLDGANALALPTKLGQEAVITTIADGKCTVDWEAYHQGQLWLKAKINYTSWEILECTIESAADFVLKVLQISAQLSHDRFLDQYSYSVKTNLQFPATYGLGSSSTLMCIIAQWTGVCPYRLNELALGGSGYDIAVAQENSALLYSNQPIRTVKKLQFQPKFSDQLIFIHLNQKQDSREGIRMYRSRAKSSSFVESLSNITQEVIEATTIEEFSELMTKHEAMISGFLGISTVKETLFSDCPVFVKSLGAWGGDFVLTRKFPGYQEYFSDKNFQDIWDWSDIIA